MFLPVLLAKCRNYSYAHSREEMAFYRITEVMFCRRAVTATSLTKPATSAKTYQHEGKGTQCFRRSELPR